MTPTLEEIGEESLLQRFVEWLPPGGDLLVGAGDDCAVVAGNGEYDLLWKTDAVVEGVHFAPETPAEQVGRKALARVVSDIAAMGGRPWHVLVTLVLPATTTLAWVESLYHGLCDGARSWDCRLAGGETSRMPAGGVRIVNVAASGRVPAGRALLRSGGRPGDLLAVTGVLGRSFASGHHLDFEPRLAEAAWLAENFPPAAMMDLSDGLARDLPRLASASNCGFELEEPSLPRRDGATVTEATGDGEDYELLLAVSPETWPVLRPAWRRRFPATPLTAIGRLTTGAVPVPLSGGWDHFGNAKD